MKIQLVGLNARFTHSCPALYYVRQELEKKLPGCRVEVAERTINDPYYHTLLSLSTSGAEALFFSVYVWNVGYVRRLLADLNRLLPGLPLVLGGPQAAALDEAALPASATVALGPVEGLEDGFFRDLGGGRLKRRYQAAPRPAFALPLRPDDFAATLANRSIYYESARGCPFACTYCLSAAEQGVQQLPLDQVRAELAAILAHKPKTVRFVDRTFNANPSRAMAIWAFLIEQETDTLFHFEIAPDLFTDEMFDCLQRVPLRRFQFEIGIQSTNPATLAAVNRRMEMGKAASNLRRLLELDTIHLHLDLILGLPEENEASFARSFNEVYNLAPHYIQMGLLKILPHTPIAAQAKDFGIIHCSEPPYEVLATRWLDHPTLARLHDFGECVEAFFNNRFFRSLCNYVRQHDEPYNFFSRLTELAREHGFFARARTPELLSQILGELARERQDGELLRELLRYDWLRCGHRFLPDHLSNQDLKAVKDHLWQNLPDELPPYYSNRTARNEFFKRTTFARLTRPAAKELNLRQTDGAEVTIAFLPQTTAGVFSYSQVTVLAG